MSEIADFLRAWYTEARAVAEACLKEVGSMRAGDPYPDGSGDADSDDFPSYPWGMGTAELAYIQRQQPQDVIADLDAKLALIDDLLAERHHVNDGDCWYTCPAATEERDGGESCDDNRRGGRCDCGRDARVNRRLAILAQPFAGQPGHKGEEWVP